jgi:hypothetical protein
MTFKYLLTEYPFRESYVYFVESNPKLMAKNKLREQNKTFWMNRCVQYFINVYK